LATGGKPQPSEAGGNGVGSGVGAGVGDSAGVAREGESQPSVADASQTAAAAKASGPHRKLRWDLVGAGIGIAMASA
jgi:hypothetical protein